jgi:hypothetical protein
MWSGRSLFFCITSPTWLIHVLFGVPDCCLYAVLICDVQKGVLLSSMWNTSIPFCP